MLHSCICISDIMFYQRFVCTMRCLCLATFKPILLLLVCLTQRTFEKLKNRDRETSELLTVHSSFEEPLCWNFFKLQQYLSPWNCFPCALFWLFYLFCAITTLLFFYPAVALFHLVWTAARDLFIFVHSVGGAVPLFLCNLYKVPVIFSHCFQVDTPLRSSLFGL